ncbi:unnamed protein product [Rotaria sp. Silwood1]|nr:unnamed protein product [Rotaria sp. Silwood1]CAF1635787.1 unnamed protein product [Rotaria sp. Silwood1]CAF3797447.1 unnamed protein product [Rotaria sp. Silwood1]CAF3833785.1 unnamed protein product [Rotaria sp. Silwood1]CAF3897416.1 unnamed protein product [Rotaria sp. Silwood1]
MDINSNVTILNGSASTSHIDVKLGQYICLILLSTLLIPSILFALYIFYLIFQLYNLRSRLTNHIIIGIFIISFIQTTCEMPFLLKYLSSGRVSFESYGFCKFWISFNYSLNTAILFLNSHLSIERYLLIFHQRFLNRHKISVHYVPMIVLTLTAVVYSCAAVIFAPCEEVFDYTIQICGGSCYQLLPANGTFDLIFTVIIPLSIIVGFNAILMIRVIKQKRRMLLNVWKKNLKMLIQLLSVSMLHVAGWMPFIIAFSIVMTNNPPPEIALELQSSWILINVMYIGVVANPFVCMFAVPEIKENIILFIDRKKRRKQRQINTITNN